MANVVEINENSNLVKHARRELELIGEEEWAVQGYLKMLTIFSEMGHSGGSASVFIPTLNRLLHQENLAPITDNPDEWALRHEAGQAGVWQNTRYGALFSDDGGITYYNVEETNTPGHEKKMYTSEHYKKESN